MFKPTNKTIVTAFTFLLIGIIGTSIVVWVYAPPSTNTFTIASGMYPQASYTIYPDGSTYYTKNAYGEIPTWGRNSNQTSLWESINNNGLSSQRTWKEKIVFIGNISIDSSMYVNNYTVIDLTNARITLEANTNHNVFTLETNPQFIEIYGGILDGNYGNQGEACDGIHINSTYYDGLYDNQIYIHDITIINFLGSGVLIDGDIREVHFYNTNCYWNREHGFKLGGADHKLVSCVAGNNEMHGFWLTGGDIQLETCKAFYNGKDGGNYYGFFVDSTQNYMFSACHSEDNKKYGVVVYESNNILLDGFMVNANGVVSGGGLKIDNSEYITVTGGHYYDDQVTPTQDWGIEETGTSYHNVIIGVTARLNTVGGITTIDADTKVHLSWNSTTWIS